MFTLTFFSRRPGVALWGKLLISLSCLILLSQSGAPTSIAAVALHSPATKASFQPVETFDSLAIGPLHQQGNWVTSGSDIKVAADPDPNHSGNRVMWVGGRNVQAYKAFAASLADGAVGTIHFRLRRGGPIDGYAGASAQSAPNDFPAFEAQFGGKITQQANSFVVRDGTVFKDVLNGFTDNTWHCVWLVANNQTDNYAVYVKGGVYPNTTRLDAAGDADFGFRNSALGNVGSLRTFFTKAGDNNSGSYYFDDIYIDPTGENLSVPGTDCSAASLDTTPPTLTWLAPVDNGQVYQAGCGMLVPITVAATDAGGISRVEFWRWDAVNGAYLPLATDGTPPYETIIDVCTLNFDWNEIDAIAVDNVGNQTSGYIWLRRNAPPTVNAGADQTITLPAGATLIGAATDDGLPDPPNIFTVLWSRLSGPGAVTFADVTDLATTATFSAAGLYTLRLTVDDGQLVTTDDLLVAVNSGAIAPTPAFATNVISGTRPLLVNFTDKSLGTITNWLWDFGDGGISVQQHPSHTYLTAGDYTVSLTVSGPGGTGTEIAPAYIQVFNPPAPSAPTLLPIENSDLNGAYTVAWNPVAGSAGYELQEQLNSGAWNTIYSGVATSQTLVDKANGAWCYQARVLAATANSDWSSAQCTTVKLTPTPTATVPITVPGTNGATLYLPVINNDPTPMPPPVRLPSWQRVSQSNLNLAVFTVTTNNELFAGERKDGAYPGGIYRRSLVGCPLAADFTRLSVVNESVLGLIFVGSRGLAAADQTKGIYYTDDNGANWQRTTSVINRPRTIAAVNGKYYVGTEEEGFYLSETGGATWAKQTDKPLFVNVVKQDAKDQTILWVGANGEGISIFTTGINRISQNNDGLSGAALNVWDFAFDTTSIYVATSAGVFSGNGAQRWQPFGDFPTTTQVYSLEIMGGALYAGTRDAGVWRRPLNGSEPWTRLGDATFTVRDLLHEPTHCQGLLAATADGVWLYR
ncbi:MAG: PKD domain-containing protein [Caldilinea sp. CFX5]|nr:PKD domain-containing protein [Caldilinea sp. CFX5]